MLNVLGEVARVYDGAPIYREYNCPALNVLLRKRVKYPLCLKGATPCPKSNSCMFSKIELSEIRATCADVKQHLDRK